jgi:hypothetical protein
MRSLLKLGAMLLAVQRPPALHLTRDLSRLASLARQMQHQQMQHQQMQHQQVPGCAACAL